MNAQNTNNNNNHNQNNQNNNSSTSNSSSNINMINNINNNNNNTNRKSIRLAQQQSQPQHTATPLAMTMNATTTASMTTSTSTTSNYTMHGGTGNLTSSPTFVKSATKILINGKDVIGDGRGTMAANAPTQHTYKIDNKNSCNEIEESCLLGIDCNEKTTVGLVLRILGDTAIRLDGDG